MTTVSTSIQINAPKERVWEILQDFKSYPLWNPFITEIQYSNSAQTKLDVKIALPGFKTMTFKPQIQSNRKFEKFSWLGKFGIKGLFDGYHSFELEENRDGRTTFIHSESFSGILVPFFKNSLKQNTLKGFQLMNESLKQRAES